jgi:regulatory protein YycH of two-component signal transduction system YycFG
MPLQIIPQLFKVAEGEILPKITFNRVYFEPDMESKSLIKVSFLSTEHNQMVSAEIYVQETNPYMSLLQYMEDESQNSQIQLISFEVNENNRLYLPKDSLHVEKRTYPSYEILDWPLINNLFQDPMAVKRIGGYFTDGDRMFEPHYLFSNKKYMEYNNPVSQETKVLTREELLSKSISFVNNHDGWTDQYVLMGISDDNTTISFQLFVNGYPILDSIGEMQQIWKNQELTVYNRPLIDISDPFDLGYQTIELASGEELVSYLLSKQFPYNVQLVEDVRIGYSIDDRNNEDVITVSPKWFVKVNNNWRTVNINDTPEQGGL